MKYPHAATAMIPEANVVWNRIPHIERFEGPTNSMAIWINMTNVSYINWICQVYWRKYILGNTLYILRTNPEI